MKLFGCAIMNHKVPIEITPLRRALKEGRAVGNIHLAFWPSNELGTGASNMETANIAGKCVYATWFYTIGSVSVNIIYAEPTEHRQGLVHSWHPKFITKRLKNCWHIKT